MQVLKLPIFKILSLIILIIGIFAYPKEINAQVCDYAGQCVNNKVCDCRSNCGTANPVLVLSKKSCGSADLGAVAAPQGVAEYDDSAGAGDIGFLKFLSTVIRIITIGAGLWTVGNFAFAGIRFVAAFGDPKIYSEAKDSLTWSLIGLVIIAVAYLLAGIVGLMFFGDAGFLLNPQLQGALSPAIP